MSGVGHLVERHRRDLGRLTADIGVELVHYEPVVAQTRH